MNSCLCIPQYFCSSVMNPISAADTADFSHPEILWNSMARSASASSQGRIRIVLLSHTSISSWCRRCWGRLGKAWAICSCWLHPLEISHMARMKDKQVTGSGGVLWLESLLATIPSILTRSDAEQRDWEMYTRVWGSGTLQPNSCLYWVQARWNAATAMQERCLGWAFILARNVSMFAVAVWNTSVGSSNQTLRHLRTWADPSLSAGEIPWWGGASGPLPTTSPSAANSLSSLPSKGCTSILPKVEAAPTLGD